jgi:hypothetical protein
MLDRHTRLRRPSPPAGWYLERVARREVEMDCFDGVEGLRLAAKGPVEVFNAISLLGALPGSWPTTGLRTDFVIQCLCQHWQLHGLPAYAQFDNDSLFQGGHHYTDTLGRVIRLCLQLGVIPVFAPPRETGFQASIENYNGRWQSKVWNRFRHPDLASLQKRSDAFVTALRARCSQRIEAAPPRLAWPQSFQFEPRQAPKGLLIYLRRTNHKGHVLVMGKSYLTDPLWVHRLVRAEVHLDQNTIRFFSLRRREPQIQPLIASVTYHFPSPSMKRTPALADPAPRKKR